jgi:phospholipase D1/2
MAHPAADAGRHPNPTSGTLSKLRSKVDHLSSNLSRVGIAVTTTLNPNHRHDEEWEREVDAKMEAIRDAHRFRSFAQERQGNVVKWHVDGHGEWIDAGKPRQHEEADGRE